MPKYGVEIRQSGFIIKPTEFRKALDTDLQDALLKTAVVYARTLTHGVRGTFPVKTGMAAGSIVPLVDFLRKSGKRIENFRSRVLSEIDYEYTAMRNYEKSFSKGVRLGKRSGFVTALRNQYGPFRYTFSWYTQVPHYILNDQEQAPSELNLKHPTPWNTLPQAREAAIPALKRALKQVRRLKDFAKPAVRTIRG